MCTSSSSRDFSNVKHTSGSWRTSSPSMIPSLLHPVWRFISFKRDEVAFLAHTTTNMVLDAGCGTGAYAQWFRTINSTSPIVAADISFQALKLAQTTGTASLLLVCCDLAALPFKENSFSATYSIDALGHIVNHDAVLDELLRVNRPAASLLLHSECADYRRRWPDRALIRRLNRDLPAENDGHIGLYESVDLYTRCHRRFSVVHFYSPAGIIGWLIGYPEKYLPAFSKAHMTIPAALCLVFATIKATPLLGGMLRFVNACTNRTELWFNIQGGGSCFLRLRVPPRG